MAPVINEEGASALMHVAGSDREGKKKIGGGLGGAAAQKVFHFNALQSLSMRRVGIQLQENLTGHLVPVTQLQRVCSSFVYLMTLLFLVLYVIGAVVLIPVKSL